MSESSSARVAVVVGVGAGLGSAFARRFAQEFCVALVARSTEVTGALAEEIRSAGGTASAIQSDATKPEQVAAAYERVCDQLGSPEILIYNGGRRALRNVGRTSPAVVRETRRGHNLAR